MLKWYLSIHKQIWIEGSVWGIIFKENHSASSTYASKYWFGFLFFWLGLFCLVGFFNTQKLLGVVFGTFCLDYLLKTQPPDENHGETVLGQATEWDKDQYPLPSVWF